MSKNYKLVILPLFQTDLEEIVDYITNQLKNPEAAHNLVNDIELAIKNRVANPLISAPYPSTRTRKLPYYRINVRNFSIFYVVYDNVMEVRRILYAKRNLTLYLK